MLDGAFPRLNRAKNIKMPELGQANQFETMSKVRERNAKGRWSDGSRLGWITQSSQDWQIDMTGHQREMSLCEMVKYARVKPVMAIAPRTMRFSTGKGSPMTSSKGVKYLKGDSQPTHSRAGHSF